MRLISFFAALLFCTPALADHNHDDGDHKAAPQYEPAPQWFKDDVAFLTRDGGRWVTSNADYQSENEPFEFYVIEWKAAAGGTMTGRLFALRDGAETGAFWEFRQYWHPGDGKAVIEQFGAGGAIGIGAVWPDGDGMRMKQTFYAPNGSIDVRGHVARNPDADTHITESFTIEDGDWKSNRVYTWRLEKLAE